MNDRTIVEYKVLETDNARIMTKDVNNLISKGWHVYGPLSVASSEYSNNYTLFQTMVKYSGPTKIDPVLLVG